jgi:hypothetical protein
MGVTWSPTLSSTMLIILLQSPSACPQDGLANLNKGKATLASVPTTLNRATCWSDLIHLHARPAIHPTQ